MSRAEEIAARIHADHAARRPFESCRPAEDGSLALAYAIQDGLVRRYRADGRGDPAGWKIGLTSARMQAFCGLDHPLAGVILAGGICESPARASLADHGRLGLECEIALHIGRDLPPTTEPLSRAEAESLVAAVAPAFELIDDRGADYARLDVFSIIADNGWNAGAVLGEGLADWPDLAACRGRLAVDGEVVEEGSGAEVLGHPLEALVWLAAHLGARGETLPAGSLVMTGSMIRTHFAAAGRRYRFLLDAPDGSPLGEVEFRVD